MSQEDEEDDDDQEEDGAAAAPAAAKKKKKKKKKKPVAAGSAVAAATAAPLAAVAGGAAPTAVVQKCPYADKFFTVSGTVAACLGFEVGVTLTLTGGAAPVTTTTGAGGTFSFPAVQGGKKYSVEAARGAAVFVSTREGTGQLTANKVVAPFRFKTYEIKAWVRGVEGIADAIRVVLEATGTDVVLRRAVDAEGKFTLALPQGVQWAVSAQHDVYAVMTTRPMREKSELLIDATLPVSAKPRPADAFHVLCAVQRGRITGSLRMASADDGTRGRVYIEGTALGVDVADDLTFAFDAPVGVHNVAVDWSGRVFRVKDTIGDLSVVATVRSGETATLDLEELRICVDGTVTGVPAAKLGAVVLTIDGHPETQRPGSGGLFRFFVPARSATAPVPYTLSASHPDYGFTPASRVLSPLVANVEQMDFVGKLVTNRKVSGRIVSAGVGVGGHVVRLYQGATYITSKTTLAVGDPAVIGTFEFTGLESGRNYQVQPDPADRLSLSLRSVPGQHSFSPIAKDEVVAYSFDARGALSALEKTNVGITDEMQRKLLSGETRTNPPKGPRLVGGHSATIATALPAGLRQEPGTALTANANGTQNIMLQGQFADGTWSNPKQSTLPPATWTDEDFLRAVVYTSKNGNHQSTDKNGNTTRRAVLRRAPGEPAIPWIVITDASGHVTCGYPTA